MALNLNSTRLLALQRFILPPLRLLPPKVFFSRAKKLGLRLHCSCVRSMHPPLTVRERIDLSDKEEKIFRRLLDVLDHFKLETQLRVAGGWVRDKLLGKDSYDIDIALDNMLGRDFCGKVNKYLEYIGEEQEGVGVIQCNPDQSKHLETARMRIYDTWIDFVNLRSETYAENSRIPTMEFGTAEQDAYRRDLTINSLFYNINTKSVEDLTGAGIKDLKEGRIATPLPPKETFLDDPLRVLRAIRFGARFDFKLAEDLQQAASDEEVKAAMTDKISRERIGHEIDLMISGNQPVKAMTYIRDLQLFFAVFTLPENPQPEVIEGCDRLCVSYMETAWKALQLVDHLNLSDEQHRLYLYGALFLPLRNSIYIDKKSKKIPIVTYIFRNSLKLKANDAEMVVSLHATSQRFISLIPFLESGNNPEILERELEDECLDIPLTSRRRVLAGLVLRQIKVFWRVALLMSTLIYPVADRASDIFIQVERSIVELGLDKVWEVKPLLDGRAIMGILQLKTGGPLVREWQEKLLRWQLAHPQGTAEECRDWMAQSQAKRAKLDCCS